MPDEELPADPRDAEADDVPDEPVFDTESDEPAEDGRLYDTQAAGTPGEHASDAEAALAAMDLGSEIEAELTEERDERVSPLILGAAVVGLLVGLFVWGSLAMSVMSSTEGLIDDVTTGSDGSPALEGPIDCEELAEADVLTEAQAAVFVQRCGDAETDAEEPAQTDPALNRADCDAIRGTDYRSPEEREWFLANCVQS